jgi:selenide,water dikinase
VTGFGLLGHLSEFCQQAKLAVTVHLGKVPFYAGAQECVANGIFSSLQPANTRTRRAVANHDSARQHTDYPLLFDPQTAGGLLAAVPVKHAAACVAELRNTPGAEMSCIIGEITAENQQGPAWITVA